MPVPGVVRPAMLQLAAEIERYGVRAAVDPRDAHPPVVLLLPERVEPRTMRLVRVTVRAVVIAPGAPNGDALAWLDQALPAVWAAAGAALPAELSAWTSPHTGTQLMSYDITIVRDVEPDPPQRKG